MTTRPDAPLTREQLDGVAELFTCWNGLPHAAPRSWKHQERRSSRTSQGLGPTPEPDAVQAAGPGAIVWREPPRPAPFVQVKALPRNQEGHDGVVGCAVVGGEESSPLVRHHCSIMVAIAVMACSRSSSLMGTTLGGSTRIFDAILLRVTIRSLLTSMPYSQGAAAAAKRAILGSGVSGGCA